MHLQLESATDSFNLDDVLLTGQGVQVLSGVTGLGLPPVAVQWLETAGDGAVFRGRRALPRDIDLPLYLNGGNRAGLIAILSRLSRMLSGELTLRAVEDNGTEWTALVHHVGGGDYNYGADTVGGADMSLVLTLRSGSPYWLSEVLTTATHITTPGDQVFATISYDNQGDVAVYPTFVLEGPISNVTFHEPSITGFGGKVVWNGSIWSGQTITFDFERGSVIDGNGVSRYAELAVGPTFWKMQPGPSSGLVYYDAEVAGASIVEGPPLINHVTNPRFQTNLSGWALGNPYGNTASNATITQTRDTARAKMAWPASRFSAAGSCTARPTGRSSRSPAWTPTRNTCSLRAAGATLLRSRAA